ncbi:c-type cytochrome [Desertivirga arenae]|uniref:c-type cytochrome n=1 Tax=Desertivirga arenae TaxID=2810309 RepID=UPI001A96680E|nr:c-type cytochrome [Pedobacter sp. SYSU D00823]
MKHTILALSFSILLASCGGSESSSSSNTSENTSTGGSAQSTSEGTGATDGTTPSSESKGSQLIATSDCLSCHKEHDKLVGPAYAEVAKKYENTPANVEMLANKIIQGGAGNWGDIPMTPHSSISKADAEEMAKYILTIK